MMVLLTANLYFGVGSEEVVDSEIKALSIPLITELFQSWV